MSEKEWANMNGEQWTIGEDFFRVCTDCKIVYSTHPSADYHHYHTGHSVYAYPTHEYMELR